MRDGRILSGEREEGIRVVEKFAKCYRMNCLREDEKVEESYVLLDNIFLG